MTSVLSLIIAIISVVVTIGIAIWSAFRSDTSEATKARNRKLEGLERKVNELGEKNASLAERTSSFGSNFTNLDRELRALRAEMVPRREWETRHNATEAKLERILDELVRSRDSSTTEVELPQRRRLPSSSCPDSASAFGASFEHSWTSGQRSVGRSSGEGGTSSSGILGRTMEEKRPSVGEKRRSECPMPTTETDDLQPRGDDPYHGADR